MPEPNQTPEPLPLRVSVLLLAYNQAPAVRRALAALEQSERRDQIEIIVVDCASTDGTSKLDHDFPAVQILRLPHHIGAGRALNIGARTAKGDYVLFLSPDVEVLPNTVMVLADALDADEATLAACPLLTDAAGQPTPRLFKIPAPSAVSAPLAAQTVDIDGPNPTVEFPSLDALLIRRQFIGAMNYFDQRYGHYWVDAELAMQIRRAAKKIRLYPAVRATLHPGPDPLEGDTLAATDRVNGAAEFAGKYGGGALNVRLSAALSALAGFKLGQVFGILGGQKLDGGQVG